MNQKEKQKKIDNVVRIFRETLESTYLKGDLELHAIGVHKLTTFFCGSVNISMKNNGNLRMSGEIPKEAFRDGLKSLPRTMKDWKIFPLVITLFHEEEKK